MQRMSELCFVLYSCTRLFTKYHLHAWVLACEAPCISKNMDNPRLDAQSRMQVTVMSVISDTMVFNWASKIWCFSTPQIVWSHPFHRGLLGQAFYKFCRLTRIGCFCSLSWKKKHHCRKAQHNPWSGLCLSPHSVQIAYWSYWWQLVVLHAEICQDATVLCFMMSKPVNQTVAHWNDRSDRSSANELAQCLQPKRHDSWM